MKDISLQSKAAGLLIGIGFSAACYALPILAVHLYLGTASPGGTGFGFPIPFIGFLYFLLVVVAQIMATAWLVRKGRNLNAIGVWLFYPFVALSVFGYGILVIVLTQ